jgi:hypothetical protein
MVNIDIFQFGESFEGLFDTGSRLLMKGLAVGESLCVKLEKMALTSREELAELSSLAHQRNLTML